MKNGNGSRNGRRFAVFHERLGSPPFAPDFLDSLARVMADPTSCLQERVLAWVKYFAWGNYSECAIRIRSDGSKYELRQKDCAEDLAWLQTGARAEWLDSPSEIRLIELNRLGVKPISKSRISRAFEANESRGSIERDTGHTIQPTVSPKVEYPREFHTRTKGEYRRFLEWAKVAHSREFEELEVARSAANRLRKFFLSQFKAWKATQAFGRNGGPSLEASETEETVGREAADDLRQPADTPTHAPRPEVGQDNDRDPAFAAMVEAIESVAVPVVGESPTEEQYLEIYRRLNGASAEHFKQRMEAKKAKGKLNSVMILRHLADDCARSKDKWQPTTTAAVTAGGRKTFKDSVTLEAARRLKEWGRL